MNPIPLDGVWQGEEWKLYCVYTAWIAVELLVVYFFYVETKGPTLEEIARIFDGEDAAVGLVESEKNPELSNVRRGSEDKGDATVIQTERI